MACPAAAVPSTSSATESPACATVSSARPRFQATIVSVAPEAHIGLQAAMGSVAHLRQGG